MKFYKVPKLGAYMAVPLVYNSCELEGALDAAVADYQECEELKEKQTKEKEEYEEEKLREQEEKEKEGVPYEPEEKEWDKIEEKEFECVEESFVVCLDTMGQDSGIDDEQKRFVLSTVRRFKELWEETERTNLTQDREKRLKTMVDDKDFAENETGKLQDEEDKNVEEVLNAREGDDFVDEEAKELEMKKIKLKYQGLILGENELVKKNLLSLADYKVLKMTRTI